MLVVWVVALGCGREPAALTPRAEVDTNSPDSSAPDSLASSDLGAEPRELLRYAERAPSRTLELSTSILDDSPMDGPMLRLSLSWTGVEAEDDRRRYAYEVLDVGGWLFEPTPGAQRGTSEVRIENSMRSSFEQVAGEATGTGTGLDAITQTRGISMQPDPGSQLEVLAVPLPSEAIGVGANWTRTGEGFSDRYTLFAREGESLTIDYSMTSEGTSMSGRLLVSLSDPIPRSGTLDITTEAGPSRQRRERIEIRTRE